jgi:hypothetical protein
MGFVYSFIFTKKIIEGFYMTAKKIKIIGLLVTFLVTLYYFVIYLIRVISFFRNPLEFSFMPVFIGIILLFVMLFHLGGYVLIMDEKAKKHKVEDIDEWWTKWNRD